MNTFNPQKNLNEWIQNDWESDDYIEKGRGKTEVSRSAQKTEEHTSAGEWILAALIYLAIHPIFWIALIVIALIVD